MINLYTLRDWLITAIVAVISNGAAVAATCPQGLYAVQEFETTQPSQPANSPKKIQITVDGQERIATPDAAQQLLQALRQIREDGQVGYAPRSDCTSFSVREVGTWAARSSWVYDPATRRMSSYIYGESMGLQGLKFSILSAAQYANLRQLASASARL